MDNAASVTLPSDLMRRVEEIANASSMSTDDLVNQIVRSFVIAPSGANMSDGARLHELRISPEASSDPLPPTKPLSHGAENAEKNSDY